MQNPVLFTPQPSTCTEVHATARCGFPSPAEDLGQARIDLNQVLVRQPDATFYMRVRGDSMQDAGICDGDFIIVDRSLDAKHGDIVVAVVDGEFTVKTLYRKAGRISLQPANPTFPEIRLQEGQELVIWGVVTWSFKRQLQRVSP